MLGVHVYRVLVLVLSTSTRSTRRVHVKLHVCVVRVCDVCCTFDFDFWGENLKNLLAQVVTRYTRLEPGLTVSEKCNMVLNIWTWLQRVIIHCTPVHDMYVYNRTYIHVYMSLWVHTYTYIHSMCACTVGSVTKSGAVECTLYVMYCLCISYFAQICYVYQNEDGGLW